MILEMLEMVSGFRLEEELQRFRLNDLLCRPVLCELCDAVLITELPEEERNQAIIDQEGETLFFSSSRSIVCASCHAPDDDEIEDYREATF